MNIIEMSIRRPVFAWILMSALIIFGGVCLSRIGVSQMPDIDFPVLSISVDFEGASPEVIEKEILEPIEQRLLGVEGIIEMRSSARQGSGSVRLDFDINRDVDVALQEVQSALSRLVLPPEIDPPTIRKQNPEDEPIMMLGISANKPLREVIAWTDNVFLDQIRFLPAVGEAAITGFAQRNLRIWALPRKLKELDLTIVDLLDTIALQHKESAAGQFVSDKKELRVRWLGEAFDVKEFEDMRILRRGSGLIQPGTELRLKDVARVEDGLTDIRRMGRIDGKEAIFVGIRKQRGTNEVSLSETIHKKIEELQKQLPEGYNLQVNIDYTAPTKATVDSTMEKLVVAGIITIVICFLFLGSLQSAINILFSIPTSILGTFIILYFSGMTMNLFTLLALTLAISIVVDDAIMLLENIVRHHRMGKSPAKAAYDGSIEILPSAIAASLSVIAIFLPVVFMDGIIGKFFFQFGIAMSGAILLSLIEAVTITPMRAAALLATSPQPSQFERSVDHLNEVWSKAYQKLLHLCIKWPKTIVFSSVGLFIASMSMIQFVKQEFIPAQDQNVILVNGQTPTGTNLVATQKKSLEIEEILKNNPDINNYIVSVGAGGGGGGGSVNGMFFPVFLKPREDRQKTHLEVMADLRKEFVKINGVRLLLR
ncbi:MAG: efflux RND transporter permease subunit, partial [Bdellovibrio sp.]